MSETTIGDPRFFQRTGPHALARIANLLSAEPPAHADLLISGVAPLHAAGPSEITFLDNRRYIAALQATGAGAAIVHPDMASKVPEGTVAIITREPYLGWAKVCGLFHPLPAAIAGRHNTALVDATAEIDPSAEIGPYAIVGAAARIGARTRLAAFAVVEPGVQIGADCRIGAHVSISHAIIGDRVVLHPGARVGKDGFGFATTSTGHVSIHHLGRVIIGNDVEIGANSTIDRGSATDTVIGAGTRIDNLVQIGHNVRIGRACVIVAQTGIAGSATLEDFVVIAGQVGIAGHLTIGKGARIGAQSGVIRDVPAKAELVGSPAIPSKEFFRQVATLRKLAARPASKTQTD